MLCPEKGMENPEVPREPVGRPKEGPDSRSRGKGRGSARQKVTVVLVVPVQQTVPYRNSSANRTDTLLLRALSEETGLSWRDVPCSVCG